MLTLALVWLYEDVLSARCALKVLFIITIITLLSSLLAKLLMEFACDYTYNLCLLFTCITGFCTKFIHNRFN